MTFDIHKALAQVDGRLKEIEPLIIPRRFSYPNENRKRPYLRDDSAIDNKRALFTANIPNSIVSDAGSDDELDVQENKKTLDSVVIPVTTSESREKKINEISKSFDRIDKARNRRMFSSLLGTLGSRQKDDSTAMQATKLQEIEAKLENQAREQKVDRIRKIREAEEERIILTRKKALLQYAEQKIAHFELMKNSIKTNTGPAIFFLPAIHNEHTLELLKSTQDSINLIIDARKTKLQEDLERGEQFLADQEHRNFRRNRLGRRRSRSNSPNEMPDAELNVKRESKESSIEILDKD